MMNTDAAVKELRATFAASEYPADFLERFDQIECLASREGVETLIVREKGGGRPLVAKCYDLKRCEGLEEPEALRSLRLESLPAFIGEFRGANMTCVVREYIEGLPLDEYAEENELTRERVVELCVKLSDALIALHELTPPVIHRDIKPRNVIVRSDGGVALIDFDTARTFKSDADTDTRFFGTKGYAPPEQYGFSQTDCRADIYSFGVLLRFLLTGSARANANVRLYAPLERIIAKCTAFAPGERFANMRDVKKALLGANPRARFARGARICAVTAAVCALIAFGGTRLYRHITYSPFSDPSAIPAYQTDAERVAASTAYLSAKLETALFDDSNAIGTIGFLKKLLVEAYGLDETYVNAAPGEGPPREDAACFLPWQWDDAQTIDKSVMVYVAVKLYWPEKVADWSSLKDDNGYYPGLRVALALDGEAGISADVNRPAGITVGDMAVILANADRVYESTRN